MSMDDVTVRLRQRLRRGMFATLHTMEEAACEIEALRAKVLSLRGEVAHERERYDLVLQQWLTERLISDNLYADLVIALNIPLETCNDDYKTVYMKKYEELRCHGTIAL